MIRLDPVFRALADPTRRWIVEQLLDADAPVSWLAEPHPMSLTAFLRHVQVLEQCGLIHTNKQGRVRDCTIELEPLRAAERWLRRALWARYGEILGSLPEEWLNRGTARSAASTGSGARLPLIQLLDELVK